MNLTWVETLGERMPSMSVNERDLPEDLRAAFFEEIRRTFVYPYGTLLCLVGNAILVAVLWFFLPINLYDLFFNVHGIFFFPIVLASWMVSDVPATNECATDSIRMAAALGDETMVTRLLRAKHLVLWIFVTPVVVVIAAVIGGSTGDWITMILAIGWVATVPLSSLGISCMVGIIWPYHAISMKERWSDKRRWRHYWLRWGILVVLPYGLVPLLGIIGLWPAVLLYNHSRSLHVSIDHLRLGESMAVMLPVAWLVWTWGTRYAARLTTKREGKLREYLEHPELG